MMFSTLSAWLSWIETIHPVEMDLGLARIRPVAEKLNVLSFA
jgi:dihydrofolate synthase/folylpolyglutamate synthase